MALPYANSKANPILAQGRIEKILIKFGVSQINFGRDLVLSEIRVSFIFNQTPVSIPINYLELAKSFLADKTGLSKKAWNVKHSKIQDKYLKIAINASFSALEDYLKAMLTMHQMEIMTPEEIFFPNINIQGQRMIEHLRENVPQIMNGQKLLLDS